MPYSVVFAAFGLLLSILVAAVAVVKGVLTLGQGIQRIEDRLAGLEGLAKAVDSLRTSVTGLQIRMAKVESTCTVTHSPRASIPAV